MNTTLLIRWLVVTLLSGYGVTVCAQQPDQRATEKASGSITGRVLVNGRGARGVVVALLPNEPSRQRETVAREITDEEGRYRLTRLAAGAYRVVPLAYGFVSRDFNPWQQGRPVNLAADEAIENLDFTLIPGGVITGRVVTADGRPIAGQRVELTMIEQDNRRVPYHNSITSDLMKTDDRGVYRIFGLPAGRYLLSFDGGASSGPRSSGRLFHRTWHPDVTDESRAAVIEIEPGREAVGIDIRLSETEQTYAVSGRVVEEESGKPVAGLALSVIGTDRQGRTQSVWSNSLTDVAGTFTIEGLTSAVGVIRALPAQGSPNPAEFYSEPVKIEITGTDVSGLEIRVRRAASISGVVVIEGQNNPEIAAQMRKAMISADYFNRPVITSAAPVPIAADGSFTITGVTPGRFNVRFNEAGALRRFNLLRIEHNGVPVSHEGIEVAPGTRITGVRIVVAYGGSVVRGQVIIEEGLLPEGAHMFVSVRRRDSRYGFSTVEADQRLRFVIEGLAAGEYEMSLFPAFKLPTGGMMSPAGLQITPPKHVITVGQNDNQEITLRVRLETPKPKENRP